MSVSFLPRGRLGNNLFQYAAAYAFAKRTGQRFIVPNFEHADRFGIETDQKAIHVANLSGKQQWIDWRETGFSFREIEDIPGKSIRLYGYFQSIKYFENYLEDIRSLLHPEKRFMDTCAVHVRRGDYTVNPHYVDLAATGYYEEAVKYIEPGTLFLFFSDDIAFCMDRFKDWKNKDFCYAKDPVTAMQMAAECGSSIIANSSFSWWWALFSRGHIIAPDPKTRWFAGPSSDLDTKDLLPDWWMKI